MPLLPLDVFRKEMSYNPYHFWGLTNSTVPITSACNALIKQYGWQDADAAGRNEILQAIESAEQKITKYLGYAPAPRYVSNTIAWPHYHNNNLWRWGYFDASGRLVGVKMPEGYIQAAGVESRTLIGTAAVTYSDADGDGLDDTFVLTIATTVTDASQIAVYFKSTDRLDNESVGEKWRILPVSVSISGGTATIRGRSWLLVKPIRYEGVSVNPLNPSLVTNFVTELEVYQRTTSTNGETTDTAQAVLLWETVPCGGWFCCSNLSYTPADSSLDPAAVGMAIARVGIRDAVNGVVVPAEAVRNASSGLWYAVDWHTYREPDRATVRYLAGYPLESDGQMNTLFRQVVARMAAAEMAQKLCSCDSANRQLYHWQFDLALTDGENNVKFQVTEKDLDNPFGTRRGQVYAWKQLRSLSLLGGIAM